MSLSKIAPRDRALLRFHGWLLLAWSVGVGVLAYAFLLYIAHVHSMALRYALATTAFYAGGFVFGGWWYVQWWRSRRDGLPQRASTADEVAYDQGAERARRKNGWWDGLDWLPSLPVADDPISMLLTIVTFAFVAVIVIAMLWALPGIATDVLGGYLAEMVIEFVLGAVLLRRLSRPRAIGEYWSYAFRTTGLAGVFLIVLFTSAGFAIQQLDPGARTLMDFLRRL